MRTARGCMRTGLDRRQARWRLRLAATAAVLVTAVATPAFAGGAVAQHPGKNGILTWLKRDAANQENTIQGVGPVAAGQASGAKALFPGFTRAVWSPDGNSALLEKRGFGTGEIYRWTAGKGVSSRPIVTAPAGNPAGGNWGGVGNATWSPDGKRFAYLAFDSGNIAYGQIWVANADGSNQHQLYPESRAFLDLSWGRTPSGDRIAIVAGCGDNVNNVFMICTFDPDAPAQPAVPVPGPGGTDPDFSNFVSSVAWSPDGSGKLLVSAHPTMEGGNSTACNGNPCTGGTVCDRVTTVCYINGDLFLIDMQTGDARNLTNSGGWAGPYEEAAFWSPDGTKIAYRAAGPTEWASIWVADYSGGSNPRISNRRRVSQPAPHTQYLEFSAANWQPCRTPVTKACTVQAFASALGKSTTSTSPKRRHR
jgi:WD40 repeat protein